MAEDERTRTNRARSAPCLSPPMHLLGRVGRWLAVNAAVLRIGPRVGVNPDTLRGWIRRSDIAAGKAPGMTTADAATVRALQTEIRELKRANEICWRLVLFRAGTRPPVAVVVAVIDGHRARFGVEPICRVLRAHGCGLGARTYRAAKTRPACARLLSDAAS